MSTEPRPARLVEGGGEGTDARAMERLLRALPVDEDLAPATRRVWNRLDTSAARTPRVRFLIAVAAGVCVVAAALMYRIDSTTAVDAPVVASTTPRVAERPPSAGERSLVRFGDIAAIRIAPGTKYVREESPGVRLRLDEGEVVARVTPRPPDAPFVVRTARFDVRVVGTLFSVLEASGRTRVAVAEGVVEVTGQGIKVRVHPGQVWESDAPDRVTKRDAIDSADATALAAALGLPDVRESSAVEAPRPYRKPTPTAAPDPVAPAAKAPTADERAVDSLRSDAPEPAEENVAGSAGAHRDIALYELGLLQQKRGDTRGALESFEAYRRDYPTGPLAQEVGLSIVELLVTAQDHARAVREITEFLARHPRSERVAELLLLRGSLEREQGNCMAAIADYVAVPPNTPQTEDALYFTAWCQGRLSHFPEARSTLTDYLARFPTGRYADESRRALDGR